ncbi:hypothetical protein DFH28DRAFT_1178511 [Melampsora americana]|nr:hypothetical protein DFH28DRAFT_1178511 [Melampsora americana]
MPTGQPDKDVGPLVCGPHPAQLVWRWWVAPSSHSWMASASATRRLGCVDILPGQLEMNQQESRCNQYIAEVGGSFSPIDGRVWQGQLSHSPTDLAARHPLDNPVVQIAPGEYHTVAEVEEHGWGLPPRAPLSNPPLPLFPVGLDQAVSTGIQGRPGLKRSAPSCCVAPPVSKRVATSQTSTGSLSASSDRAIPTDNLIKITEVSQCPDFWAMPVHDLYQWRESVVILDRTILGYFQQALKDAEDDLARAIAEDEARKTANTLSPGLTSPPESRPKRSIRPLRSVKEETPVGSPSTSPAFKFNPDGPTRLDLIYMRALDALSPFGAKGQKGKVFHECAIWLKNDAGTRPHFKNLSESPNSRVLQVRYTQLKTWLAAAEGWSKMDSGTEEDDEELRLLIRSVQDEEETSRALRLAGQEEREAVKGRSLLAEAVREQFADKALRDFEASGGDADKEASVASSSRKGRRQTSNATSNPEDLTAITGELGRWNDETLAAQAEQNSRINELYERELVIAHARNENERIMSESLAAHRTAELALQQQRLEFDKAQMLSVKNPLDGLEAKISAIEMNTSNQKFDALEAKMGSMNDALAVLMKHLVVLDPSTPKS